jgi:hypothetical protein
VKKAKTNQKEALKRQNGGGHGLERGVGRKKEIGKDWKALANPGNDDLWTNRRFQGWAGERR